MEKWVGILTSKGRVQTAPPMLTKFRHFSSFMLFIGEVVIANVEHIITYPAKDVNGAYSAKMNSCKNLYIGLQISIWSGIALKYGSGIQKRLEANGKEVSPASKKIGKNCKAIAACTIIGCGYKFAFGFLRISKKTIYIDPPCGESWLNLLGLMMTIVSFVCTFAMAPNKTGPKGAKVGSSTSTASSTSSSE